MSVIKTSLIIHKPREVVYEKFLCEHTMPHWISGFKEIELLHGEPRQPKSKYKMKVLENGQLTEVTQELVEVIHNERFFVRMEHPQVVTYSEVVLTSKTDYSTYIECTAKVHGKGFAVLMAMSLVKSILHRRQEKDYKAFKRVLEMES